MRKLYLHIGHGKTGSSFLQASFANSVAALAASGIDYPEPPVRATSAATGWRISSGNGSLLINAAPEDIPVNRDSVFFSSEGLFMQLLADHANVERIEALCAHHRIDAVEILLFLRDPIPHAASSYQQMVKRGGATYDVAHEYRIYRVPELTRMILSLKIGDLPIGWHVHNYDRNRAGLLQITERFLGLPQGALTRGDDRIVNRSMTASEIAFLRELNAHHPASASRLADTLCNELPDIPAEPVFPPMRVQQDMLDRQADAIAAVNAQLPEAERYATELRLESVPGDRLDFSARQLEVIARTLGTDLARQSAEIAESDLRRKIQKARGLADQGRTAEARALLDTVLATLDAMEPTPARTRMVQRADRFRGELAGG